MLAINKKITAWKIRRLAKQLHQQKHFALVHGHETYFGDEAGPIGRQLGIPSIFTLHGFYQEHLKNFGAPFMAMAIQNIKQTQTLLADSSMAGKTYEPLVGRSFTPIPNGLDPLPAGQLPDDIEQFIGQHPLMLSVGALSPSKRFDVSVQALAAVHKAGHTEYRLIINGRGTEEKTIRELAKSLRVENAMLMTSGLSRAALRGLYERADIVLHPSVVEAFCIVVLEGMAAGKPVVATTSIGIMDYLAVGKDVMAVPPNDSEKFSAAVIDLIEHPDKKSAMGQTARQTAKQFTWQAVADRLDAIYQPLIAR